MRGLRFLALPCLVMSVQANYSDFETSFKSYKDLRSTGLKGITREYEYKCSTTSVFKNLDSGEYVSRTYVTSGNEIERVSEDGMSLTIESSSKRDGMTKFSSFKKVKYSFLDDNTLKTESNVKTVILSQGEYKTEHRSYERLTKLVDGKKVIESYTVNGEERKVDWKTTYAAFDVFSTKYTVTSVYTDFSRLNNSYREYVSDSRTCIYEQTDKDAFNKYAKNALVGKWVPKSDNYGELASLELNKNGTFSLVTRYEETKVGSYKLEDGKLLFKDNDTDTYYEYSELSFDSVSKIVLSRPEQDGHYILSELIKTK